MWLRVCSYLAKLESYWYLQILSLNERLQCFQWRICFLVWLGGISNPPILPSDYTALITWRKTEEYHVGRGRRKKRRGIASTKETSEEKVRVVEMKGRGWVILETPKPLKYSTQHLWQYPSTGNQAWIEGPNRCESVLHYNIPWYVDWRLHK